MDEWRSPPFKVFKVSHFMQLDGCETKMGGIKEVKLNGRELGVDEISMEKVQRQIRRPMEWGKKETKR